MDWTQEQALLAIDEFRLREVLWDPHNSHFYNRKLKEDAWNEIAVVLGKDAEEVKKKMDSLKGSYRREKARGRRIIRTKDGCRTVFRSKWFAFQRMKFLDTRSKPGHAKPMLTITKEEEEDPLSPQNDIPDPEETVDEPPPPKISQLKRHAPRLKRRMEREDLEAPPAPTMAPPLTPAPTFHYLQSLAPEQNKDEWSVFGEDVANQIRQFDDRLRIMARHRINQVLYELAMERFNGSSASLCPEFQENLLIPSSSSPHTP